MPRELALRRRQHAGSVRPWVLLPAAAVVVALALLFARHAGSPAPAAPAQGSHMPDSGSAATSLNLDKPEATPLPSPAPAPAPAPQPAQAVTVVKATHVSPPSPVRAPVAPPPAPAPPARDYLTSGDGTLHTGVGLYTDCSGATPLTRAEAAIDICITGVTYFVGHNYGPFTPLMHMDVGAIIFWADHAGVMHRLKVIAVRRVSSAQLAKPVSPDVVAQFQTCWVPDGSIDRLLDAVAA